jgi:hypothetical protein
MKLDGITLPIPLKIQRVKDEDEGDQKISDVIMYLLEEMAYPQCSSDSNENIKNDEKSQCSHPFFARSHKDSGFTCRLCAWMVQ